MRITKQIRELLRTNWIKALRSGRYKQTTGVLCKTGGDYKGYCCLGVACEVYNKMVPGKLKIEIVSDDLGRKLKLYDGRREELPDRVKNAFGINTENGEITLSDSLASLNDRGKTFKQIAKIIESKPEGLFKAKT